MSDVLLAVGLEATTRAPHWDWLAIGYFFLGGLAAGCYLLAAIADLFGGPERAAVARSGYRVAVPAILLGALLLIVDLQRPERFWHMLFLSKEGTPAFKLWSPMSVGAWALALFGAFATASALATYAEEGRAPRFLAAFRRGLFGRAFTAVGALLGFFVASYTGVLLSVTNRPLWSETHWLGFVFVASSAATSAALLKLLASRRRETGEGVAWLQRFAAYVLPIELVGLAVLAVSLGPALRLWANVWGVLLLGGVVGAGTLLPAWWLRRRVRPDLACALVLLGGILLRVVVVLSVENA